jgi:transposase
MQVSIIGLDLAKNVFQVHGSAANGEALFNRKLRRAEVLRFFEKTPPCPVAMEACGGSHYWAREIKALGHDVRNRGKFPGRGGVKVWKGCRRGSG